MKAVIFNSGLGKRMGDLTKNNHKSMVKLSNGETIFGRQIRILSECGITDFLITSGPFEEQLKEVANQFPDLNFTFVKNPIYDKTNYIYSMYLARQYFDDDVLMLHGDLVFDKKLIHDILIDSRPNLATINHQKQLPEKDFKARVIDDKIVEVGVNIFDDNCFAFQPCYKLNKENVQKWLDNVSSFIERGIDGVYAENAFNEISDKIPIEEFSYVDYYIDEVDTEEDLKRVSEEIRLFDFKEQNIVLSTDEQDVVNFVKKKDIKPLIVASKRFEQSSLKKAFDENSIDYVLFSEFSSNPKYEEVVNGINCFNKNKCNYIVSFGGGSAIDVAKCIKLYAPIPNSDNYLKENKNYNLIPHLCVPTTAGTGSESTRFAVIYKDGIKNSITHDSIIPNNVILNYQLLKSLPDYQKKSTMLDALCQAIESYWSVNSTEESKKYAKAAINLILKNMFKYLDNDENAMKNIMKASNLAGKAINISQTTAAHAMSYKITSLYGTSHGHAVALCLPYIWEYMINNLDRCIDPRGENYIVKVMQELSATFECDNVKEAITKFKNIINRLNLANPKIDSDSELDVLTDSVNQERLKNNPIKLEKENIEEIYTDALSCNRK